MYKLKIQKSQSQKQEQLLQCVCFYREMINEQQRTGFMEVLAHFYNTRFIQQLVDLKHKDMLEQLDAMFSSADREQYSDYITIIADTFNQCVRKPLSSKHMDLLFWQSLTPEAMHKLPAKPYVESFKTAVPFIHAEIYDLCARHKMPTIKLFNEDYSLITEAIKQGIEKSQKGYFAPVDSVQTQLQEANKAIRKLKAKLKSQKALIETLEAQIQEYENLAQQSQPISQPPARTKTTPPSQEESKNSKDGLVIEDATVKATTEQSKTKRQRSSKQTKKSAATDVSYLNGQAQLTL